MLGNLVIHFKDYQVSILLEACAQQKATGPRGLLHTNFQASHSQKPFRKQILN